MFYPPTYNEKKQKTKKNKKQNTKNNKHSNKTQTKTLNKINQNEKIISNNKKTKKQNSIKTAYIYIPSDILKQISYRVECFEDSHYVNMYIQQILYNMFHPLNPPPPPPPARKTLHII